MRLPLEAGVELSNGPVLVFNAQPGVYGDWPTDRFQIYQPMRPLAVQLSQPIFDPRDDDLRASAAIVHLSRVREETLAMIAAAWGALEPGGWLIVDGNKADGADAIWKTLRKLLPGAVQDSKAHGRVIWVSRDDTGLPDWQAALTPTRNSDGFLTAPGVFSADGIDEGSAQLVTQLDGVLKGRVVDLGAGWGWLAHEALARNPGIEELTLLEAHRVALDCARQNVVDPRARFLWADVAELTGSFDAIVSNPPFHAGRKPDVSLGRRFIEVAGAHLTPKGQFWMVANRQLAYEETLEQVFLDVDCVSQSNRFKVIRARRPRG